MPMDSFQYNLFGGTPPHVRNSATSQEAAENIAPKVGKLQNQILSVIRKAKNGLTRDEIEIITGLPHTTSSARVRELFLKGLLETRINFETGKPYCRPTRSGKKAEVCFAVK